MRVQLTGITKCFGATRAIDDVSLTIAEGDFFTLLGPSGCGKTTLLRTIAGFCTPEGGQIRFGDRVVNSIPAHRRETGMVFQKYALFPHLSVYDNAAYGLRARKIPRGETAGRVAAILKSVQLEGLEGRAPSQLSGGQQQRVALARALVISPQILLMDEPLSNLDAKLRVSMREEIRRIQKRMGITTIYVTHDQVLAELFTGAECPPCFAADLAFDGIIDRYDRATVAVLEWHLNIPGPDPMTNPDSELRALPLQRGRHAGRRDRRDRQAF